MSLQYMTQEGLDKLKKELAEAIAQRPVISAAIAEARDKGDLSENAEYEAAREAQGLLELNIAKLQNLVANARVIDESQIGTEKVQMLNKVNVRMRHFHAENSHTYPLARHSRLNRLGNLSCKCTEACVCLLVKVEDVVILYVPRDHEGVSLRHRGDIEECVEFLALRHFV